MTNSFESPRSERVTKLEKGPELYGAQEMQEAIDARDINALISAIEKAGLRFGATYWKVYLEAARRIQATYPEGGKSEDTAVRRMATLAQELHSNGEGEPVITLPITGQISFRKRIVEWRRVYGM